MTIFAIVFTKRQAEKSDTVRQICNWTSQTRYKVKYVVLFNIVTHMDDLQMDFDWVTGMIASYTFTQFAILHTFLFTVKHAQWFSDFTSRVLATDLLQSQCNFKSHLESSLYRLIPFPLFLQLAIPRTRLSSSRLLFCTPSTTPTILPNTSYTYFARTPWKAQSSF
jgi:hypothetical protein